MARPAPDRSGRFVLFLAIFLVVAALYLASDVLIPIALATLVSFLLTPLVQRLERVGLPRVVAVIVITLAVLGAVVGLGYIVTNQALSLAGNIDQYHDNILKKLDRFHPWNGGVAKKFKAFSNDFEQQLTNPTTQSATTRATAGDTLSTGIDGKNAQPPKLEPARDENRPLHPSDGADDVQKVEVVRTNVGIGSQITAFLGPVLGPLGTAGLVAVFAIFIMLDRENLRDRIVRLVGFGELNVTTTAIDDATTRISRYLVAQAIVNGTYGIAIGAGIWAIGRFFGHQPFPSAILWGLLCALLRFLPYIGPWIGAAFPMLVAFAVYPGFTVFAAVVGLFIIIELLSNNFMEPWLYGSSTGMSTIAVLVSAVFWTWLWGPVGLVLATPLTVCLVVLGKYVPKLKFFEILLGADPVFAPHERIYQRLLAMDAEEATEIAEGYFQTMPLEEVYDTAILPALAMVEQDRHQGVLDDERLAFARNTLRELVEELGDRQRIKIAKGQDEAEPGAGGPPNRWVLPKDCIVNVSILAAHDEGDELVAFMLAQLLDVNGYCPFVVSGASLASEMVERVKADEAQMVVVSAMPPGAVTHARYLCKRLQQKFPDIPTLVGLWTYKGDLSRAGERIAGESTVTVETTIATMLADLDQRARAMILQQQAAAEKAEEK
jgi:predicted PurR-regulated permease PerM